MKEMLKGKEFEVTAPDAQSCGVEARGNQMTFMTRGAQERAGGGRGPLLGSGSLSAGPVTGAAFTLGFSVEG